MHNLDFSKKPIIWMIHLPPLIWYKDYPWESAIINKLLRELEIYESAGIDAIMLENNYDIPHYKNVPQEILVQLTKLSSIARAKTNLPLWICVLWNDWKASLSIAKLIWLDFIRIPVFVDTVETYGFVINPIVEEFNKYRNKLNAYGIDTLVDVHVKHSKILSHYSLEESIQRAVEWEVDTIIITWNWTWDLPALEHLKKIRNKFKDIKIIVGSWVTKDNFKQVIWYSDAFIVWTYFKTSNYETDAVNIRDWKETIDFNKVVELINFKNSLLAYS